MARLLPRLHTHKHNATQANTQHMHTSKDVRIGHILLRHFGVKVVAGVPIGRFQRVRVQMLAGAGGHKVAGLRNIALDPLHEVDCVCPVEPWVLADRFLRAAPAAVADRYIMA